MNSRCLLDLRARHRLQSRYESAYGAHCSDMQACPFYLLLWSTAGRVCEATSFAHRQAVLALGLPIALGKTPYAYLARMKKIAKIEGC